MALSALRGVARIVTRLSRSSYARQRDDIEFPFSGGRVIKVVYDIGADAYVHVERELAAVMARD